MDLSVVIGTMGRPSLVETLRSIDIVCDIVVVEDTNERHVVDSLNVRDIVRMRGGRYFDIDAHGHFGGHPQIQYGHERANGHFILNLGDDDVFLPGALDRIKQTLRGPVPHLYRAIMKDGYILWNEVELRRSRISGQCIAVPNDSAKMGFWWDDYSFIAKTIENYGECEWVDQVIIKCG